jgi:hypothetical protein
MHPNIHRQHNPQAPHTVGRWANAQILHVAAVRLDPLQLRQAEVRGFVPEAECLAVPAAASSMCVCACVRGQPELSDEADDENRQREWSDKERAAAEGSSAVTVVALVHPNTTTL